MIQKLLSLVLLASIGCADNSRQEQELQAKADAEYREQQEALKRKIDQLKYDAREQIRKNNESMSDFKAKAFGERRSTNEILESIDSKLK